MSVDTIKDWLISGISWGLVKFLGVSFVVNFILLIVVRGSFGLIKSSREATVFVVAGTLLFAIFFYSIEGIAIGRPNFRIEIVRTMWEGHADLSSSQGTQWNNPVIIAVKITNVGITSSVGSNLELLLERDGQWLHGVNLQIPDEVSVFLEGGEVDFTDREALCSKAPTPISLGSMVVGYLIFTFPMLTENAIRDQTLHINLHIQDVNGKVYTKEDHTKLGIPYSPVFIPGLNDTVRPRS